jgi:hypothetical protein
MTATPDTTDAADLDEVRALWAQEASKRTDALARFARLDEQLQALREQQAAERADAAAQLADANAQLAQLAKRIRTREAASAAGDIEILTPEAPQDGDKTPNEPANPPCNAPHPTDRHCSCKRFAGHDGDHAAHTFRISAPETWPAEETAP